ncbi:hypothetical protein ACFCYN_07235 [Gottfriedia sp. NPDC056225]|uniref:hypothetical protein n=1 Tax=Gottfriedia sp. NPDC056225 TaxID=3345751 RepID=UPI0035DE2540
MWSINWVIRVGLCITGLLLITQGIYTTENNKEHLSNAAEITIYGNEVLGCFGLILTFVLGGFLRFLPVWLVRSLWFLLGIGFIVLGVRSNLRFLLHP